MSWVTGLGTFFYDDLETHYWRTVREVLAWVLPGKPQQVEEKLAMATPEFINFRPPDFAKRAPAGWVADGGMKITP